MHRDRVLQLVADGYLCSYYTDDTYFYFLLIRPQQKKEKQRVEMKNSLRKEIR
jgi:hypothetical protein